VVNEEWGVHGERGVRYCMVSQKRGVKWLIGYLKSSILLRGQAPEARQLRACEAHGHVQGTPLQHSERFGGEVGRSE